ncbi:MAG: hypothetical protein QM572_14835 [Nocardioides sp.]|uniref:hypothetical protein n=1 Tax=Nocardioides sp. TaxID=35761 RepID=UPI0039E63E72
MKGSPMLKRTTAGLALGVAAVTALTLAPAHADLAPQPDDVVTVGSDIQQNAFNFLADGYGELPGYNSAGNKWRFVNFDSSGDGNGRSAWLDPSNLTSYTGSLDGDSTNEKYVKLSDASAAALNPTATLQAGQNNVVRPSGGSGGLGALLVDGNGTSKPRDIDVARNPNLPTAANQTTASSNLATKVRTVQIATDRDLIATATDTNVPDNLTAKQVLWIYTNAGSTASPKTWGDLKTWNTANNASESLTLKSGSESEVILPLFIPSSAGMQKVFLNALTAANGGTAVTAANITATRIVQQNDPTTITGLSEAERKNALVPFPKGRYVLLGKGYYANPASANSYSQQTTRSALSTTGLTLQGLNGSAAGAWDWTFSYNAIFRDSDVSDTKAWQPGGKFNWVRTLFYNPADETNPDGVLPFVQTEAGKQLLEAAGVTPAYEDKGYTTSG